MTPEQKLRVGVYSGVHCLVDFGCALLMFSSVRSAPQWMLCMLLYNFFAFAGQMPLGLLADRWNRNALFAALGCWLIAAAYPLAGGPLTAAVLAGVGNGMFHVGAGVDVLSVSGERSGALGVFVSPGALGLYAGTLLGRQGWTGGFATVLTLLLAGALMVWLRYRRAHNPFPNNPPLSLGEIREPGAMSAILCLMVVVCLRSYVGLAMSFPWKGIGYWGVALTICVALGKTLGGFASDRFGPGRTGLWSLIPAALLFLFPAVPAAGVLGVLLFNMSMPITLWAVARLLPGARGFSFGLLTAGLFVGYLPVFFGVDISALAPWLFAGGALLSLVILRLGLRRAA